MQRLAGRSPEKAFRFRAAAVAFSLLLLLVLLIMPRKLPPGVTVLKNKAGMEVHILSTGAVIQKLIVPDSDGNLADIVLGFDDIEPYKDGTSPYMGAVVGRVANRIAGARFQLDGEQYQLAANNDPNCLHGGKVGYDKVEWRVGGLRGDGEGESVQLTHRSSNGEEGFPGQVDISVTYTLTEDNRLVTEMHAVPEAPTPINLAQHSYFNLGGHDRGTILTHLLTLHGGDHYTPVDDVQIPTGEIASVRGTPFDFTTPRRIGERIQDVPGAAPGGYDHNFVLFGLGPEAREKVQAGMASETPQLAATLVDPASGRGMEVLTTAPGVQFYSGNFLDGTVTGKGGAAYGKHAGLCLETQGFPDAVNQPGFPSIVLRPPQEYRHVLVYRFFTT